MSDYKLVPVELIERAAIALERFANDTLAGRNSAHELRELLAAAPAESLIQSTVRECSTAGAVREGSPLRTSRTPEQRPSTNHPRPLRRALLRTDK